jgi:peptide/nickel transport system permease protein
MANYLVRRLLLVIPTLFFASLITFLTIRLIPGDVIDQMMKERESTNPGLDRAMIERSLGLDAPIHVQYARWVGGIVLRGDLGKSLWSGTPVTKEILTRLPVTFELGLISLVIGLAISLPIGIFSAVRQDGVSDYLARGFAILCIAVPGFWLGTMVIVFPAKWWGWSPPLTLIRFSANPLQNLVQFLPPAIVLGTGLAGVSMRMTRSMMLEVMRQDYIRTAWAKGMREWVVIARHALRNAFIPIITIIGMQLPILVGGTVIIEQIFALPGIGRLTLDAITARDYTVVAGVMLFIATFILVTNILVDITYGLLDPRVQYK